MEQPMRLFVAALLATLAVCATAGSAAADQRCASTGDAALATLRVRHVSCRTAARVAHGAVQTRTDRTRYAAARRCSGDFCIVVDGWRCRPLTGVEPRERCVRGGARLTFAWRT
jgi:hypothetical protein